MSKRPIGDRPAQGPISGAVRMRRALALAGCGVLSVGLSACESTEQESAKIGRENELAAHASAPRPAARTHGGSRAHRHTPRPAPGARVKGSSSP
jgi:hypothetical protein